MKFGKLIFIGAWLALFLLFSGCLSSETEPVACTMDAKICPDGTAVGRIPPDCRYAACPDESNSVCVDDETKNALCPDGVTTYLSKNCVDGEWHAVMYIRNPCSPLPSSEPDIPDNEGMICPSVCVEMWGIEGRKCVFTDCGSGCGPDGLNTFETEEECKNKLGGEGPGNSCDAFNHCEAGLECFKFEDESTPICWEGDPCEKCETGNCVIAESYPAQIFCQ